jgi:hypothetical protein
MEMKIFPRYLFLTAFSLAIAAGFAGCKSNPANPDNTQNQAQDQNPSQDPAAANVAPISNASAQGGSYDAGVPSTAAPQSGSTSNPPQQSDQYASDQYPQDQGGNYDNGDNYDQPVDYAPQAPPPLPEYDQPPCPGDDYIWTPGYWNYASDGYYWVPGAWVNAPYQGALWTPGYWSYDRTTTATATDGIAATGGATLAIMAGSTTDSATSVLATRAVTGMAIALTTTVQSTTRTPPWFTTFTTTRL